jgi:hypothetical protein
MSRITDIMVEKFITSGRWTGEPSVVACYQGIDEETEIRTGHLMIPLC